MKEALARQLAEAGVVLLEMEVVSGTVVALVDESLAAESLCPLAFDRFVGALSWSLLGVRLSGRLEVEAPVVETVPALAPRRLAA